MLAVKFHLVRGKIINFGFFLTGGDDDPQNFSLRLVTIAMRIVALFIVPAYTGALLSFILTPSIKLPFENVQEFVEDGTYKAGYVHSMGFELQFLVNNFFKKI